jgi:hypothetical protein
MRTHRRMFLGTTIAAGVGSVLLPADVAATDAVLGELTRQLEAGLDQPALTAGQWTQKASALRLLAAYVEDQGWDAKVRAAARRYGRRALAERIDVSARYAKNPALQAWPDDVAARARALRAIQRGEARFGEACRQMATVAERLAERAPLALAQTSLPMTPQQACQWMSFNVWYSATVMFLVCAAGGACVAMGAVVLLSKTLEYWYCS